MYDLAVDGVRAFYQRRPGALKFVRREPLVGAVDGSNTIFLLSQPPALQDTLILYGANDPLTPLQTTLLDADGGVVQLYNAPTNAVTADYTAVPLYTKQVVYVVLAGFQLMESLWQRGLEISADDETFVQAGQDDAHLYIVTRDGTAVADPVCGDLTFNTAFQQRSLLARCIEMAFLGAMASEAALSDVSIRERLGGVAIDPTKRTLNILAARKDAWAELCRALESAQEQFYGEAGFNAELAEMPSTVEYTKPFGIGRIMAAFSCHVGSFDARAITHARRQLPSTNGAPKAGRAARRTWRKNPIVQPRIADGMKCIALPSRRIACVRWHRQNCFVQTVSVFIHRGMGRRPLCVSGTCARNRIGRLCARYSYSVGMAHQTSA